jgi:O-antigen ligase
MKSAAAWQIAWMLLSVIVFYVLASGAKRTTAIAALLLLIPFQAVDHRYASSSVLIAYALFVVLLLNGGVKVRMLPALGMIVLTYLISLTHADRDIMSWHVIFLFSFFSCFVVFLIAYNYALLVDSERVIVNLLLATNVLVVVYCMLQLTVGAGEGFVPFGLEALAFNNNREPGDARLVGPFASPGTTSTYFMFMAVLCAIDLIFSSGRRRWFVAVLIFGNLLGLVATANRGAFLILVAIFPVLLFMFRSELGARRVAQYIIGGTAVLAIASAVAITYTDFGRMYNRMDRVAEIEDGVPAGRAGAWTPSLEKLWESPWIGEGPLFLTPEHGEMLGILRTNFDPYPHSLYLYLFRTVGILGLAAMLWFFVQAWRVIYAGWREESVDVYRSAILRFGLLLIPAFFIDQIRLEFHRPNTMDFAQFIFALIGLLVGVADRVRYTSSAIEQQQWKESSRLVKSTSGGG